MDAEGGREPVFHGLASRPERRSRSSEGSR
jgi:hypothetical protein